MENEINVKMTLPDMTLTITSISATAAKVTIIDTMPGWVECEGAVIYCTPEAAAAIMALAFARDVWADVSDWLVVELYDIAEPVLEGLAPNLRPIP